MSVLYHLFLIVGLGWGALAQQIANAPSSADPIPDYLAFRLFFAAVAESSSPSPADTARQDGRLNPIQLAAVDKAVLVGELSVFKTNLASARNTPQTSLDVIESGIHQEVLWFIA